MGINFLIATFFNGMGYDGDNISPHLAWDDVPMGTKVLIVICYDRRADRLRLVALGGGEPPADTRAY